MSSQVILHSLAIVLVIAAVTMLTRFAPFLLFSRCERVPRVVSYLGAVMPAAIIMMLIVYCLRTTTVTAFPFGLPELIACVSTAAVHFLYKNTLLSISGGTILYMVLVQVVFAT